MRFPPPALVVCGAVVTLVACSSPNSDPSGAPTGASANRPLLFDGSLSTPDQEFAVLLVNTVEANTCTGVVIAPNLVLTALHCVAPEDRERGEQECPVEGADYQPRAGTYGTPYDASHFAVRRDFATKAYQAYGVKVLVPDTEDPCGKDIAAVVFDRPIGDIEPAGIRETAPEIGEVFTAVGHGVIDDQGTPAPTRLQRTDMRVLGVGPGVVPIDFPKVNLGIPLGDIATTGGVCFGDSGGPLLDAERRVVGIASRVVSCSRGPAFYTGIEKNLAFVHEAEIEAQQVLAPTPEPSDEDAGDVPDEDAGPSSPAPGPGSATAEGSGCSVAPAMSGRDAGAVGGWTAMVALLAAARVRRRPPRNHA